MSTCIMYLNEEPGYVVPNMCDRCYVTDGDVTHDEYGRTKYHRPKLYFSFLQGKQDYNAQAVCLMAVGSADAANRFLCKLREDVRRGTIPDWRLHDIRSYYADIGVNDDYELFLNILDVEDGRLSEHAFVLGKGPRGTYTFDVKEDIEAMHGYGIGVDGAKMIIALDAVRAAGVKPFKPYELDAFFCNWSKSLHYTGESYSIGVVSRFGEGKAGEYEGINFSLGHYPFSTHQDVVASICKTETGLYVLRCSKGDLGPNTMVSYSVEGEMQWTDSVWEYA